VTLTEFIMSVTLTTVASPATPIAQQATAVDIASQSSANKPKTRYYIPRPSTKEAERRWQLEQMAGAFRVFAKLGFADGGSGHISVRGATPSLHHFDYPC
jgi:hypothetical protein